ncbi:origin recognition complex subunit 2-domain-containing protein [Cantharellus anzutake]|uniref:origin recognition complex subunit 2-domain-containing protein n=1 Tax=Cantharellus anzutake TaxID=1750568 RepID=UPI0019089438|nr:origin recognition complex subunit 2-domain-containing protein [Cantharellus anzutake]KAF8333514.1 origin recognition complex subunit 2-domain-containing protein [Cantharellus anzutake]
MRMNLAVLHSHSMPPTKRARAEEKPEVASSISKGAQDHTKPQIILVSSATPAKRTRTYSTPSKPRKLRTSTTSGNHIPAYTTEEKEFKGKGKASIDAALENDSDDMAQTPSKSGGRREGFSRISSRFRNEGKRVVGVSSDDGESESDENDLYASPRKTASSQNLSVAWAALDDDSSVRRTSSDIYFCLSSHPSKTSDNVFTALLPYLTMEECRHLLSQSPANRKPLLLALQDQASERHVNMFREWEFELGQGFNLLFYGYGSKRGPLNKFAMDVCRKIGNVVIVNGYLPSFGLKGLLESIEQIPGLCSLPVPNPGGIEGQTRRIYEYFLPEAADTEHRTDQEPPSTSRSRRPLFLFIHNIDSPHFNFQNLRTRSCLSLLASNPRIHVAASLDNIHAPIMWSTQEMLSRKHSEVPETAFSPVPSARGFAWIWHELATFAPYTEEIIASRDISALPKSPSPTGASASKGNLGLVNTAPFGGQNELLVGGGGRPPITELQASQVLGSVTLKARRLFKAMGMDMLTRWAEALQNDPNSRDPLHTLGMPYTQLMRRAKEEFLASNDLALRGLLQEFRDHGLVRSRLTDLNLGEGVEDLQTGEMFWIPLPRDFLERTVAMVDVD